MENLVNKRVRVNNMPSDSFYKKVEGVVQSVENGRVTIKATNVMSKWANEFKKHPSSCAISAKIENVTII
jgi:hypothetical protein